MQYNLVRRVDHINLKASSASTVVLILHGIENANHAVRCAILIRLYPRSACEFRIPKHWYHDQGFTFLILSRRIWCVYSVARSRSTRYFCVERAMHSDVFVRTGCTGNDATQMVHPVPQPTDTYFDSEKHYMTLTFAYITKLIRSQNCQVSHFSFCRGAIDGHIFCCRIMRMQP